MGKIIRFHPLNHIKQEEKLLSIKGIDMTYSQFREEVIKQEIQRELDRRCTGCTQYNNCEQGYDQQQACWSQTYGHYLKAPE